MKAYWCYEYPIGSISIAEKDGNIAYVLFTDNGVKVEQWFYCNGYTVDHVLLTDNAGKGLPPGFEQRETPLIKNAAKQMSEYFAGRRREFDLPLEFNGTDFQKRVWEALLTIPFGETCSYGEIAAQIGNPKAARAVGMANNRNPISIICPCHRVIGSDGSLIGYGGGLANKEYLLRLESRA